VCQRAVHERPPHPREQHHRAELHPLGICPAEVQAVANPFEAELEADIAARIQFKKDKNFAASDAIRDKWLAKGIELRDTPDGTVWKKV
jgi:cysteinyl-tRNA synthetase